jgi:hypothetical protein
MTRFTVKDIETALHRASTVIGILTAEKTQKMLAEDVEDVEKAVGIVMDASQDAANDVISVFQGLLEALEIINSTRYIAFPKEKERRIRVFKLLIDNDYE